MTRRKAKAANDPQTRLEWQEAVNAADFLVLLDSARLYGLVTGGPAVNVERCERILADGKAQGIVPCGQYCRVCGCTEEDPCDEGCWWIEPDLCSACGAKLEDENFPDEED